MKDSTDTLKEIFDALQARAEAYDTYGPDSPQYVATDGRLIAAKERHKEVRPIGER